MKILSLPASLIACLLTVTTSIQAEETIPTEDTVSSKESTPVEEKVPTTAIWSGNSELGFIQTNGNSDTQSFNGKFNIVRDLQPLKTSFKFEALTSEENGTSSKEKYHSEFKLDYSLGEFDYFTSLLSYEDDRFSGFQYQSTLSLGYGYRAWNDENGKLDLEVGPGYRRNALEARNEHGEKIEEEAVGRFGLNLEVKLGDNAKFTEVITIEGGNSSVVYKSDMGLQSSLIGALAMKINYQIKHTDEVPEGTKNTDSTVGVTLVYSF
jgi:putative salt-induced outer membrane protein YdiY